MSKRWWNYILWIYIYHLGQILWKFQKCKICALFEILTLKLVKTPHGGGIWIVFFLQKCLGIFTFQKKLFETNICTNEEGECKNNWCTKKMYPFQDNHTFTLCFAIHLCTRSKFIRQLHSFVVSTKSKKYILGIDLSNVIKLDTNFENIDCWPLLTPKLPEN